MIPACILMFATFLFPYVIYFEKLTDSKIFLGRLVPWGGFMHMVFWLTMCAYYKPSEQEPLQT